MVGGGWVLEDRRVGVEREGWREGGEISCMRTTNGSEATEAVWAQLSREAARRRLPQCKRTLSTNGLSPDLAKGLTPPLALASGVDMRRAATRPGRAPSRKPWASATTHSATTARSIMTQLSPPLLSSPGDG